MKKYLQKSMTPNEQVVLEAKFHWILYVLPAAVFLLNMIGAIVTASSGGFLTYFVIGIVLAIICLIPAFKHAIFSELAVTNKKVFGKTGFIKTAEMNSPIRQVQNVTCDNGLFGKIFNFGTITITTASGIYIFKYVSNPNEFKNTVMAQYENTEESKMDLHAQKIADAINGNKQ